MNEVMVSVYCMAYNHEKYITSALEGFIRQKTDFKFEVYVHDDASKDKTADIIRKYAEKYPDIIKPIYQTENQYSKGVMIVREFIYPKCRGKYIAICEGDDYWCDEMKLQKQVDYMEKHPECTFCFSNGYIENQLDGGIRDFLPYREEEVGLSENSRQMNLGELLKFNFVPTASFMYRTKIIETLPESFDLPCPAGDLRTRIFFTGMNKAYYFADKMVTYRENVPGSAMYSWRLDRKHNFEKHFQREKQIVNMLYAANDFTEGKYEPDIMEYIDVHIESILLYAKDRSILKDAECERVYKKMSLKKKIKFWAKIIISDKLLYAVKK